MASFLFEGALYNWAENSILEARYISIRKKIEEDNCRYLRLVRIRRNAYMKHQWQILEIDHKEDCEQELPKIKCKSPSPNPFNHFDRSHGF